MGRKSTHSLETLHRAVGAAIAHGRPATIQAISAQTRVPTGSIYHRFASREVLLAETWLAAVGAFQERFLEALASGRPDAGEQAALATPRFCRERFDDALVLACWRKADALGPSTPPDLARRIGEANTKVDLEIGRFAERTGQDLLACRLALSAYPLAAVRLYLPNQRVPEHLDEAVLKAYRAALAP